MSKGERKKVLETQPLTKWISVIETDGFNTVKKKHLVRLNQTRDIDRLKSDLTSSLQPVIGPVRHIYTPAGGTEVISLDQIQKDKEYLAGVGNQNFRKLSQVLHSNPKKKKSVSSIAGSNHSSSKQSNASHRLTLMQRQDLIAQQAKERLKLPQLSPINPESKKKTYVATKVKKPIVNRKPLYPGARKKEVSESAKSTITIKGNFIRAARLTEQPRPSSHKSSHSADSYTSPDRVSAQSQKSRSPSPDYDYETENESEDSDQNSYQSQSRSPSPYTRSEKSPVIPVLETRPATSITKSETSTRSPTLYQKSRPASYISRNRTLGSAGSSQKSSNGSPNQPDSRPDSVQSNNSFVRQSVGQSLGQSILRKAVGTAKTEDYIDRDEDNRKSLRYGNSFSRESTATGTHDVTVTSQGHGVDNNDAFGEVGGRLQSQGSLFSYKFNHSPKRSPSLTK